MFDDGIQVLMACILAAGITFGSYQYGYESAAVDCVKLGGFYVGKTVYKCEAQK